jgi:AraC-like DNA-binding protein
MITPDLLKRMCRARARLQSELEPPTRVSALAREAGLSTAHFIHQFGALFGQTPLQCRTRARLERARDALLATDESATQIGLALGFDNPGSFSRVFTRHAGLPPRAWRRTARPDAAPAGCVALMNLALAADRHSGEVAGVPMRHDGVTSSD